MKGLINRFAYYLSGVGIGLIGVYIVFGNRGCSWLPENRVKNSIAEREIRAGDSIRRLMECKEIDRKDVYRFLKEDGTVRFSKSKPKGEPKEYRIEGEKDGRALAMRYALYDSVAEIIAVEDDRHNCTTSMGNFHKTVIELPDDEVIAIIESHELRILAKAMCAMSCYDLAESEVRRFHASARVDLQRSNSRSQPHPIYWMKGEIDGLHYAFEYVIGNSRTRISTIVGEEACACR